MTKKSNLLQGRWTRRLAAVAALPLMLSAVVLATPAGATSLNVSFITTSVNFGSVTVATTATGQVNVTNTTGVTLYFVSADVHGGNANDFTESSTGCTGSIAATSSCSIDVAFTPTGNGDRAASLGVTLEAKGPSGNVIAQATVQAELDGVGATPIVSLSDASAGSIAKGSVGVADATLTNNSDVSLTVHSWSLQGVVHGDFSVALSTCPDSPMSLAPGQSCSFLVKFSPVVVGDTSVTLNVSLGVVGASSLDFIGAQSTISGTGTLSTAKPPLASLSALNMGSVTVGTSATGSVALVNTSGASLSVSKLVIGGTSAKQFTLGTSTCGTALAVGASCSTNVTFTPAVAHKVSATFGAQVVPTGDPQSKAKKVATSLAGTGVRPQITLAAPNFGTVTIGSSTQDQVVVSNDSLVGLNYDVSKITGPHTPSWSVNSTTCIGELAPAASCEVNLNFAPHTQGDLSSVLSVVFSIHTPKHKVLVPSQVNLSGAGAEPTFSLASPAFASTAKGVAITGEAVISNTSDVSMTYVATHFLTGNSDDFTVTASTCTSVLTPAATCDLTVSFSPSQPKSGVRKSLMKVVMQNDGVSPTQNVSSEVTISATES